MSWCGVLGRRVHAAHDIHARIKYIGECQSCMVFKWTACACMQPELMDDDELLLESRDGDSSIHRFAAPPGAGSRYVRSHSYEDA